VKIDKHSTKRQSLNAYKQWGPQWRRHAKIHKTRDMKSFKDFQNSKVGKAALLIANGASFEENIEAIKENQDGLDIMVCDKTLGHCIDNGIIPTYVMVCDANVDFDKYLKPWKDKLKDVILFSNVCGNPLWTTDGIWKDVYFFVNEDVIKSEVEFSELSGCKNLVPAATNVSNQMLVVLTQSNNDGRANFFGYDKYLLIGYDYSWTQGGSYYSFDKRGGGKQNYMRHLYITNCQNDLCYTSNNLLFSSSWIAKYVKTYKLPVVQCSKSTILDVGKWGDIAEQMNYSYKTTDKFRIADMINERLKLHKKVKYIESELKEIGKDHYYAFLGSI